MPTLTCSCCGHAYELNVSSLISTHRTSEGTVGYARCPSGHLAVVQLQLTPVI
jgi:hypothetical protein